VVESIAGLFAAFGLSASAGLNAYVPLLIVALMARFTDWITLSKTWEPLTSWWTIAVLVILGVIEFFVDKVPAVNHVNDAIQTFIRPTAGAILFAASTSAVTNIHPVLAIIAGVGNVPVSVAEDVTATVISILAVVLPVAIAALIIMFTAFVVWWLWRRANVERATKD
jgi:hypothetical protein